MRLKTISERIDAITEIPEDRKQEKLAPPRSVKIELTARCNFACAFCARSAKLRDQKDMDQGLYESLALEMREAGVEELGLFYLGESFLLSWLEEAIGYAKKIGYPYVFLTTNGSLAIPKRVETCIRNGLDSLKFSLNYAGEKQFCEIARVKAPLYRAMLYNIEGARKVRDQVEKETGHRCGLYGSYIQYDGDQGKRMAESVEALRPYLDEIYALPLYNQADLVTEEGEARNWSVTAGNRGRLDALRDPIPCWAVFTEGHITFDGKLSACCFDHDGRFHMGDLTRTSFLEAWNSDEFQRLRKAHLNGDVTGTVCETCAAYSS
ncbi:MAG: radical SAM/SPASM domain-containing protein [Gammaproteobacteria bacterium]